MHHFFLGPNSSKVTEISPEKHIQRWAGTHSVKYLSQSRFKIIFNFVQLI